MTNVGRGTEEQETLTVSLEPVDRTHVRINVVVPAEVVEAEVQREFAQLGRRAKVPGFRPGRVPSRVLETLYWPAVRDEVQNRLVARSLAQAIQDKGIEWTGHFELGKVSLERRGPLSYSATIEVWPRLGKVHYEGLEIEAPRVDVSDDAVEEALRALQERHARLIPVEDRDVVGAGDVVEVVWQVKDVPKRGSEESKDLIWLRDVSASEATLGRFVGKRVGDTVDLRKGTAESQIDEKQTSRAGGGVCRIEKIYRREVPELNDEFVKTVSSNLETLAELRRQLRDHLEAEAKRRRELLLNYRLKEALVAANPDVLVPPRVLAEETASQARRYFARYAIPPERAEELMRRDPEVRESLERQAFTSLAADLLLGAVAEQEGIGADEADVERVLSHLREEEPNLARELADEVAAAELRSRVKRGLILQRALERVREKARFREQHTSDNRIAEEK